MPKPLTKLVWDNVAHLSPKRAAALGVKNEDVVAIEANGKKIELPVWVLPGQPGISWQGHLFGAIGGVLAAWWLSARGAERGAYALNR